MALDLRGIDVDTSKLATALLEEAADCHLSRFADSGCTLLS